MINKKMLMISCDIVASCLTKIIKFWVASSHGLGCTSLGSPNTHICVRISLQLQNPGSDATTPHFNFDLLQIFFYDIM